MNAPLLKHLEWDSAQLGIRCGLIHADKNNQIHTEEIAKLLARNEYDFITIKLGEGYLSHLNSLIGLGARLIDTELTFQYYDKSLFQIPQENTICCRFLKTVDPNPFFVLAQEMACSRFYQDPNIPKEKAAQLWKISIQNHCEGFADRLLVAYIKEIPCGIATLAFRQCDELYLHIVGVLPQYQGKGVARAMLNTTANHYAKTKTILIETQSRNKPAQAAYQKAGFHYDSLKYILHYWQTNV